MSLEKLAYWILALTGLAWLVRGNTIRARHLGKDILAGFRMLVGGEVSEYTKMLAESREQSIDRMVAEAQALGAAELLAYGTAVKLAR